MVGWSGAGSIDDLRKTTVQKLAAKGVDRVDGTLIFESEDPVDVARRLGLLPGVAWIAAGARFRGDEGYLRELESLGKRYLRKGDSFAVSAQVEGSGQSAGDYILSGNSALLSGIRGTKVKESTAQTRFRVCVDRRGGACGVEIRKGPGGSPTRGDRVAVLVSGGAKGAYLAWTSALSGYALRLVHSKTDEVSLRQVAKLYSELSFRMDPRYLELVLLDGGASALGRIGTWLGDYRGDVFAGLQGKAGSLTAFSKKFPNLSFPLLLSQGETIQAGYRSLELGPAPKGEALPFNLKALEAKASYSERKFGGKQADSNEVIDGLRRG